MVRHSWAGDASEIEEKKAHIFARKQKNPSKTLLQLPPACIKRSGHPPGVLVGVIGQGFSFWCNGEAKSKKVTTLEAAGNIRPSLDASFPDLVMFAIALKLSNQAHSISLDWRSDLHVILYIAVGIIIHKIIARR
ncbi:hypothetical protein V6N11_022541 [Hibiscus sabdariffa]|uniref:Uncharacterized protein n=1 Tax=Hibiscus sabdariffa TaxID=183260 RepID=A0ABR2TJH1_9ROSI